MKELCNQFVCPKLLKRGICISLIVGSILILINQGPLILKGETPAIWQIFLTYLVPFCVSSTSSALANIQKIKAH